MNHFSSIEKKFIRPSIEVRWIMVGFGEIAFFFLIGMTGKK